MKNNLRSKKKKKKQIENKRPNEYHFDSMGKQSIPSQNNLARKDREDLLTYFGNPKSDKYTSERQAKRKGFQSRKVNALDSKHPDRQTIIKPSQDWYDDQRSERHDCKRGPMI